MPCFWSWNSNSLKAIGLSEAELLRARAKCYLEWAIMAREGGDQKSAEYLTALATECLEDAAALDNAEHRV